MEKKPKDLDAEVAVKAMNAQKLLGLDCSQAFLHQSITWPGVFGGEKNLSHAKVPGMKMSYAPGGLILKAKNKKTGMLQTAIVPLANVAVAMLSDE